MFGDDLRAFALISLYSPPDEDLLRLSCNALVVCGYLGDDALMVVNVGSILSVIAMVPFPGGDGNRFFLIEKIGLDVIGVDNLEDDEQAQ